MKLLGDWNWYLPSWLEWLPTFEHEEKEKAPEAPPVLTPSGEVEAGRSAAARPHSIRA